MIFDFCLYGRVCRLFVGKQTDGLLEKLPDAFQWSPPTFKEIRRGFAAVDNIIYAILYSYHFKEEFIIACRRMQDDDKWKRKTLWQMRAEPAAAA